MRVWPWRRETVDVGRMTEPRIGLAISGGGFRAACFGLGCLRALHDQDLLRHVRVISGISGRQRPHPLSTRMVRLHSRSSTRLVVGLLRHGMQLDMAARALRPDTAARNLADATRVLLTPRRSHAAPEIPRIGPTPSPLSSLAGGWATRQWPMSPTRTLATVITATDLRTTNAMRFGSLRSSCSAYGTIVEPVRVAEAVAASGAFPLLLPAVERSYNFRSHPDDPSEQHALLLTDGGGLRQPRPLVFSNPDGPQPTRPTPTTSTTSSRAMPAAEKLPLAAGHFAASRLKRSFDVVHKRSQDAGSGTTTRSR